ncbi:hypothetical protein I79_016958 [Cricetulus griseus]|uniref:Uncharacterized protein n=1 Tax=Cricetulus griseus TaxID=10029 RepID=G3I0R9_CRIGR|nr:hypothetical protein I79_016958 [Cricetulus griseus]
MLAAPLYFVFFLFFFFFFFLFFETGFLCGFGGCPGTSSCRPGWSQTHRDPSASASRVLGLKACATNARLAAPLNVHLKNSVYFLMASLSTLYFQNVLVC